MLPPDGALEDAFLISLSFVLPLTDGKVLRQFVVQTGVRNQTVSRAWTAPLSQRPASTAPFCSVLPDLPAACQFSSFVVRRRRVGNCLGRPFQNSDHLPACRGPAALIGVNS